MKISRLELSGFRNIENIGMNPFEGVNILYGDNAQGKTNILEAIWLFTGEKSFRGSKDSELLRFSSENARIELDFYAQQREQSAKIIISQSRSAWLNGVSLSSPSELAGILCAVVFSPDDLSIIKEGPAVRRTFLDVAIGQLFVRHGAGLNTLRRILAQRNALLKDIHMHAGLLDMLPVWDERLAKSAAQIISARLRYISRLSDAALGIYSGISKNSEVLSLSYASSIGGITEQSTQEEIYTLCLHALAQSRAEDLAAGMTSVGPHRDELQICIDGLPARIYGSQGQQRSCALALKLAECGIIHAVTGEQPIILLDDVMSELDENRRDYLLNHITGKQVFITCCDTACFIGIDSGAAFHIRDGSLAGERSI